MSVLPRDNTDTSVGSARGVSRMTTRYHGVGNGCSWRLLSSSQHGTAWHSSIEMQSDRTNRCPPSHRHDLVISPVSVPCLPAKTIRLTRGQNVLSSLLAPPRMNHSKSTEPETSLINTHATNPTQKNPKLTPSPPSSSASPQPTSPSQASP
jgi:hypothetical protein